MLNYNDLYELLRKEKYGENLQLLPKNFTEDFSNYLTEIKERTAKDENLFMENTIKSKKQLENSIAMFKELMRIRKKKLLSLVFVATETGIMKRDYENMIDFEKETFDRLVKSYEDCDKEITKVLNGSKDKHEEKNKFIIFNTNIEQFMDMNGQAIGPFKSGELANLDSEVAGILVSGGKASFVDE